MNIKKIHELLYNRSNREQIYGTAEFWDNKAKTYNDSAISMWPNKYLNAHYHKEQMLALEKFISDPNKKNILDIGCGTGRLSRMFAEKGASVTGFDFSARSIEIAKKIESKKKPLYKVASLFELNEKNHYDVALTWGVLTIACKDREQLTDALQRIFQSLRNDGILFLLEPVHRGFLHRVLDMNIKEFTQEVKKAGFEIIAIENLHFWPMRILLAYIQWPKWITDLGFLAGQWLSIFFQNSGDYKVIYARKVIR